MKKSKTIAKIMISGYYGFNLELLFPKKYLSLSMIAKVGNIRAANKAISFIKKISRFKKRRSREN
ncbi:unnamed protein product, partial [marine sediment metagenome]